MRITGRQVIDAVARHYKVSVEDLKSDRRYRAIARPRQVAMYLMRKHCPHMSLPAIGRVLGDRDHTTILHGVRNIERLMLEDLEVSLDVSAIADCLQPVYVPEPITTIALPFHTLCNGYAAVMRRAA